MYAFWKSVIEPLFRVKKPKKIVEIGAGDGYNTYRLLQYCKEENAELFVIEPTEFPAWANLKQQFGSHLHHIRDYSLDVLPLLEDYDAILVDGDHNWYTVFNELKLIEHAALRNDRFPLVLLHDTEWPYGRRDMYYFPESIPEEHRHPNALKGIVQGNPELVETGGINYFLHNALVEFGPKNGVLTAVEDFLKETPFSLSFHNMTYQHGLGIISTKDASFDWLIQLLINQKQA